MYFSNESICLYGDNAYVNTSNMVTPFKMATKGLKDDFNFYHSQLRINIENAFGMLVKQWRILQTPLANISLGNWCPWLLQCIDLFNVNELTSTKPLPKYKHNNIFFSDFQKDSFGNPIFLLHQRQNFDESNGRKRKVVFSSNVHSKINFDIPITPLYEMINLVKEKYFSHPNLFSIQINSKISAKQISNNHHSSPLLPPEILPLEKGILYIYLRSTNINNLARRKFVKGEWYHPIYESCSYIIGPAEIGFGKWKYCNRI